MLLHLVDHTTRLSATTAIPSKDPDTIIKAIFSCWIKIYGSAEKFLTDNGGEFANSKFIEMCKSMNIKVITTAAESTVSNGLIERHNLIISEMLDKTLEDTGAYFQLVLAWCVNAKKLTGKCSRIFSIPVKYKKLTGTFSRIFSIPVNIRTKSKTTISFL